MKLSLLSSRPPAEGLAKVAALVGDMLFVTSQQLAAPSCLKWVWKKIKLKN